MGTFCVLLQAIEGAKRCFTDFVLYAVLPRIDVNISIAKDLVIDPGCEPNCFEALGLF